MTDVEDELKEVFGGPTNVAPGGTGAVLTQPSQLSMDIAQQAVRAMPMDKLYRDMGTAAALILADHLEQHGLKASDYAGLQELPVMMSKRISGRLYASEEFARALREGLAARG